MPEIKQLSSSVINKIAAGEVIERPASVVKELLENSVDAGATRVELSIAGGGSDLVRVSDNGCGIAPEQLLLAVASHATSKIRDADDLFRVASLGFRGEALASIAEVSRFLIRSRMADSTAGAQLEVVGGNIGPVEPCGCGVGTTIEVRDLFFNTPVRRKFMRAAATEVSHCTEAFTRLALAYPHVHFVMKNNDRVSFDLPPTDNWRERIATFFGADIGDGLIAVEGEDAGVRLSGYVADPNFSRANNRLQYLFLNGRCIRDRSLQHALSEAYRGLLLTGRFPIAFLRLDMPADAIDVNVHPTKLEVRFQDGGRLYSHLLGTLRRKFLGSDLTPKVRPIGTEGTLTSASSPGEASAFGSSLTSEDEQQRRAVMSWARGQTLPTGTATVTALAPHEQTSDDLATELAAATQSRLNMRFDSRPIPAFKPFGDAQPMALAPSPRETPASKAWTNEAPVTATILSSPVPPREASLSSLPPGVEQRFVPMGRPDESSNRGVQFHNRYLVTENEDGIVVIDQHALHERILYEQLREKVTSGSMETQRLLVPEPVTLTPAEAAAVIEAQDALGQIGIEVEPFGGDTVLVTSYPAMLANLGPGEVLRQILEQLMSGSKKPERRDVLDELLHMISCKAAIKAGDRLSTDEITALLEQRHLFHDTHHCPHGRPTALVFTRDELDKRFKRI